MTSDNNTTDPGLTLRQILDDMKAGYHAACIQVERAIAANHDQSLAIEGATQELNKLRLAHQAAALTAGTDEIDRLATETAIAEAQLQSLLAEHARQECAVIELKTALLAMKQSVEAADLQYNHFAARASVKRS